MARSNKGKNNGGSAPCSSSRGSSSSSKKKKHHSPRRNSITSSRNTRRAQTPVRDGATLDALEQTVVNAAEKSAGPVVKAIHAVTNNGSNSSNGIDADTDTALTHRSKVGPSSDPAAQLSPRVLANTSAAAFLPDETLARHWLFRFLLFMAQWFYVPIHGLNHVNFTTKPRDKPILFYTRHSTHNSDIMPAWSIGCDATKRVTRCLVHRLLIQLFPILRMVGAVPGERESAVALLNAGFWCAVIPGGADEGLVGHRNAYRLHWPDKRQGFARVAMESGAMLVPFMIRNGEESRWNPITDLFSFLRVYVLYNWIVEQQIPILSRVVYVVGYCLWFSATFIQLPVPVRVTLVFGEAVSYDAQNDSVEALVARSKHALQDLIDANQPNAREGRNYMRALMERWEEEWRMTHPKFTRFMEKHAPQFIKDFLNAWAGRKKVQ